MTSQRPVRPTGPRPEPQPGMEPAQRRPAPDSNDPRVQARRKAQRARRQAEARRKNLIFRIGVVVLAVVVVIGILSITGVFRNHSLKKQLRAAQTENQNLSMQMENLENEMAGLTGSQEQQDAAAASRQEAYTLLIKAQNAMIAGDQALVLDLMAQLADKYTVLDGDALSAYYAVMEYMEQPSNGQ